METVNQNELFESTEALIKKFRAQIPDDSATAKAIDREEAWGEIASYARDEGFTEFADELDQAGNPMGRLVTTREAADRLGFTPGRVRQLAQQGRIPGARRVGRDWLFEEPIEVLPPARPRGYPGHTKHKEVV